MPRHVKQTPHCADLLWSSNQYYLIFKGRTVDLKTLTLIEEPAGGEDDGDAGGGGGRGGDGSGSGGGGGDAPDDVDKEFERILRESEAQ